MREGEADPGLYSFRPYRGRTKIEWPNDKKVAVWVSPNLEFYEIDPPANPHRKAWTRPHPDVVGYSHRDYANRVGHWRMAEAMAKHGFPGSVSLSVALCQHIPEVVEHAASLGWEFFSHGIYNTRYSYFIDETQERAVITDAIQTVRDPQDAAQLTDQPSVIGRDAGEVRVRPLGKRPAMVPGHIGYQLHLMG